jgi:very-short-patch-repair endonuclease
VARSKQNGWYGVTKRLNKDAFAEVMRTKPTRAEAVLHNALLDRFRGFATQIDHQFVIEPYIADFRIKTLLIELDGHSHARTQDYDTRRTTFLTNRRYSVMRFTNAEVLSNPKTCADHIFKHTQPHQLKTDDVIIKHCPPGSAIHGKRSRRTAEFYLMR